MSVLDTGRLLIAVSNAAFACYAMLIMRRTPNHTLLWFEAMGALVFGFTAFASFAAYFIHSQGPPALGLVALFSGSVQLSVALIAGALLWAKR